MSLVKAILQGIARGTFKITKFSRSYIVFKLEETELLSLLRV